MALAAVALLDYSAMYTAAAVPPAAISILQRARARLKLESELELELAREAMGTGHGGNAAAAALKHHTTLVGVLDPRPRMLIRCLNS